VNNVDPLNRRPSPGEALTMRSQQTLPARAVSSYLPQLTRKAFEKYGFASTALLTDWPSIVGEDVASYTAPERLKWPRGVEALDEVEPENGQRPGATLVVRVDGPRAIELQHRAQQIIERINATFGYRAVSELRFVQAPIENRGSSNRRPPAPQPSEGEAEDPNELTSISDEALRKALARLQSSMRRDIARRRRHFHARSQVLTQP
jgi:hypothetical protein